MSTEGEMGAFDEVRSLKSRYFRYVDAQRWLDLRSLFTDDAVLGGFAFTVDGPNEFVTRVARHLSGVRTIHQGFMPDLQWVTAATISATWSMQDWYFWPIGTRDHAGTRRSDQWGTHGFGSYEEEYRLTAAGWRISRLALTRITVLPLVGCGYPAGLAPDSGGSAATSA